MGVTGVLKCQKVKLQGSSNAPDFNINITNDVFYINRGNKALFTITHDEEDSLINDEPTHSNSNTNSQEVIELSTAVKFNNQVTIHKSLVMKDTIRSKELQAYIQNRPVMDHSLHMIMGSGLESALSFCQKMIQALNRCRK